MSVEGDSLSFDEAVPAAHDVDPADVDWRAIFDEYAGSDGLLDMSTRADAVRRMVDGVENSRQAESLLAAAADRGLIGERAGDYYGPDADVAPGGDAPADAAGVDWHAVFESVAGGVTEPLPRSTAKRVFQIKMELGLESEDDAADLLADARDRGFVTVADVGGAKGLYLSDALEDAQAADALESNASSGDDRSGQEGAAGGASDRPDPSEMGRGDLEGEVRELRSVVEDMGQRFDAMSARMDTLTQAVFGQDSVPGDVGKSEDVLTKFVDLRERVDGHDEKLAMVSKDSGSRSSPDERAMNLRMTLYEEAKKSSEKMAVMDRDQVKYALGGGLARYSLLDAMRRAADGENANIDGSCELEDLDGLEFMKGAGRGEQSRIRLDLSRVTGEEMRKNLTTENTGMGGS